MHDDTTGHEHFAAWLDRHASAAYAATERAYTAARADLHAEAPTQPAHPPGRGSAGARHRHTEQ